MDNTDRPIDVLELFAGIGGIAYTFRRMAEITAVDISQHSKRIYETNFPHAFCLREIESLSDNEFRKWNRSLWWISPPCQPYSRRGNQLDYSDRRSFAIRRVIRALESCSPPMFALENVLGFERSEAFDQIQTWMNREGYRSQTLQVCPTEWGWKNRRPRFYLIACKDGPCGWTKPPSLNASIANWIEPIERNEVTEHLWLPSDVVEKYVSALDVVDESTTRPTACFGSSYGKSILHAGSYLRTESGMRRFTPREVARQLGFDDRFVLPDLSNTRSKSDRILWKYLGNSLSIPVVRYVLSHLPGVLKAIEHQRDS